MSNQEQSTPTVFASGATWIRADFHMHTRADTEFKYDGDPNQFVRQYVEGLKKAEIRVGVITNHNKFLLDEFKALQKGARKEEVFLLPGIELSVNDGSNGIHTLVVFSPSWIHNAEGQNYIQSFLDVTFAGKANYQNENGRSQHGMNDTIRELNKFERDYFLICAHVEQASGLWKELDGGRRGELAKHEPFRERCLAFQKVRTNDLRQVVKQQMVGCYPAEVEGCDCKSIEDIGKGDHSYLKIGAFTFEAVKFALLDHENRLRAKEPPTLEHSFIKEVIFEGGNLDATQFRLSPELNAFIGIRGSGKSSLIETIRYGLGIELPENNRTDENEYKQGSVQAALGSGGKVTIHAKDRHGNAYEIRRIFGEQPDVFVGGVVKPGINIRETILYKPIYFGQKDLSSTGQGFENELVEKLVGDSLQDIRHNIALRKQAVIETVRRLQKLSDVADRQREYQDKKSDAEHRLKVFKAHGVEEKLQKQVDYDQDGRAISGLLTFTNSYIDSLSALIDQHEDDFVSKAAYRSKRNIKFFDEITTVFGRVSTGFFQLKQILEDARAASTELNEKSLAFNDLKGKLKEEFAAVARELSDELKSSGATAIEPNEFLKLRKTIDNSKQILLALSKEKDQQTNLQQQLLVDLTKLNDAWHQEFKHIKKRLEAVNNQETALQIEVEFKGDKPAFLRYVKDLFRGSKLRETTLESLIKEFPDGSAMYRDPEKVRESIGGSAGNFENYFRDNLTAILTWQVPNRFTIRYHGKQLKHHSLGQRASALILFVLSQRDNDVVIIDQPEDDLDNQTIYEEVIKLVRKLKPETQFIFATHNANIPVLGDAEQVVACEFSDEGIETQVGSIDCPSIQDSIVRIMEGGEEAFNERKRIYQVWKHQNS